MTTMLSPSYTINTTKLPDDNYDYDDHDDHVNHYDQYEHDEHDDRDDIDDKKAGHLNCEGDLFISPSSSIILANVEPDQTTTVNF